MKSHTTLMPALGALFALSATTGWASELPEVIVKARVPQTAAARASADLIARAEHALSGNLGQVSNLWIFPTNDTESVFVQYEVRTSSNAAPKQQLALVEMRGERISRMVSFTGQPTALLAAASPTNAPLSEHLK